jgi:hypothetical protein
MSVDPRKKRMMEQGSSMSKAAMLNQLTAQIDNSLEQFGNSKIEHLLSDSHINDILSDNPQYIGTEKDGTEVYLSYDEIFDATGYLTFYKDEQTQATLDEAVNIFWDNISEVRAKPYILAARPDEVMQILLEKLRYVRKALRSALQSHVKKGRESFTTATSDFIIKSQIPVDEKILTKIEHKADDDEEGDATSGGEG